MPLVPADLGSQVWRLDYGQGDDMVVLKVNNRLPDFSRSVRQDPVFRGLVMPQVLRSILERALLVDREDPTDTRGTLVGMVRPRQKHPPGPGAAHPGF